MENLTHGEIIMLIGFGLSTLGASGLLLWRGGRWTDRIEQSVDHVAREVGFSREANAAEHAAIGARLDGHEDRLDEHGHRLTKIEDER